MKSILLLYPYNRRTIPIDIALNELIKKGYKITLLTFSEYGDLHKVYEKLGCKTYINNINRNNPILFYMKQITFLVKFCKSHKIDVVFSHLQEANLVSSVAQFFCKTKFVMFRHHFHYEYLLHNSNLRPNRNIIIGDKIVNRLSRKLVVPSKGVKTPMVEREGVREDKIEIIPYIYNTQDMLKSIDYKMAETIRDQYEARLLLIMVSRLIPYKQHFKTLPVFKQLIDEGYDIKVLIMDDSGNEGQRLQSYIRNNNLEDRIFMLGFKRNILDYIAVADILVHPSLTEASCSATKEAGLLMKLVLVNKSVGDFDDYIINEETGYSFDANEYSEKLKKTLQNVYYDKSIIDTLGNNLKSAVIDKFSIRQSVIHKYIDLLQ